MTKKKNWKNVSYQFGVKRKCPYCNSKDTIYYDEHHAEITCTTCGTVITSTITLEKKIIQ